MGIGGRGDVELQDTEWEIKQQGFNEGTQQMELPRSVLHARSRVVLDVCNLILAASSQQYGEPEYFFLHGEGGTAASVKGSWAQQAAAAG